MCEKNDTFTDTVNEKIVLIQSKGALAFGSDAYLLYAYMKYHKAGSFGVELGGGSGIISLLAASKGKLSKICSVEILRKQAKLISINAKNNRLDDKVIALNADIRALTSKDVGREADVVFTNPPYMKMGSGIENASQDMNAARRELCGDIGDFCKAASRVLRFGGSFYVVYRPERLCELFEAMRKSGIEPKRMTHVCPDASKPPCLVLVEGKKGGHGSLFATPVLIMHKSAASFPLEDTPELCRIYEKGEFDERYIKP